MGRNSCSSFSTPLWEAHDRVQSPSHDRNASVTIAIRVYTVLGHPMLRILGVIQRDLIYWLLSLQYRQHLCPSVTHIHISPDTRHAPLFTARTHNSLLSPPQHSIPQAIQHFHRRGSLILSFVIHTNDAYEWNESIRLPDQFAGSPPLLTLSRTHMSGAFHYKQGLHRSSWQSVSCRSTGLFVWVRYTSYPSSATPEPRKSS